MAQYREMLAATAALALAIGYSSGPYAQPVPKTQPRIVEKISALPEPNSARRTDFYLSKEPVQGAVIIGRVPSDTVSVSFNAVPLQVDTDGQFLIGFDRDAPPTASLVATLRNGQKVTRNLAVKPGSWLIERVNANPTGGAKTTAEFKARRDGELARINVARSKNAVSNGWRQSFIWPVQYWKVAGGRVSGVFGSQRIFNGFPASFHNGLDMAAPTGTPYYAPADGVVVLAAKDAFTLEGHLLIIDHGMGLNSAFLHSSALMVSEGQVVKQGQLLGKVGATGRASGPHLHWGMKWTSVRVNPRPLVPAPLAK